VPGQYQYKHYVADVIHFLQQQLNEPAIIFGNSTGGVVALNVAARIPAFVRGVIVGDFLPTDMNALIGRMTSDGFKSYFSALHKIAGTEGHTILEMTREIANIAVQVPGEGEPIRYGDSPDVDAVHLQQLAVTVSQMDPGVLEYHATGRAMEFLEGFDLGVTLEKIVCPILLLQGNPSLGGMMTDEAVKHVKTRLPGAEHAFLEACGHNLGLDTWDVAPLLRSVMIFLIGWKDQFRLTNQFSRRLNAEMKV
jgi:pimeloyl-ACP methyl ester carboxylesterase